MNTFRLDVPISDDPAYQTWLAANYPAQTELAALRQAAKDLPSRPLISIVMPVYNTSEPFLRQAIESVLAQVYENWELCIANDGSSDPAVCQWLAEYVNRDARIRVTELERNQGIVAASNAAIQMARGDFLALLDHDDLLTPDALYEIATLINRHPDADLIYSDEDKVDAEGKLSGPFFKPDWCPDSFMSRMYVCHLAVYRRSLVEELGGFRPEYEGGQSYDLVLRLMEKTDRIHHVPKILYHWRMHDKSTAADSGEKLYVYEADKRALEDALVRRGIQGQVQRVPGELGFYVIRYQILEPKLVSIIIPSKDYGEMLNNCLESIFTRSTYAQFEVIVVDNGSTEPRAKEVLASWQQREPDRFRALPLDVPFNFSILCNAGVEQARGEYLLFLNNDTEVITSDWLEAMIEQAQRPSIGAVGVLLLYEDERIQHAGAILGLGGVAAHSHRLCPSTSPGYAHQVVTTNNYLSVAATCLMCRRSVFEEAGRFEVQLPGDYEDLDLCLKLIERGYRNVYLPHVRLYHYESVSRGKDYVERDPAQRAHAAGFIQRKWHKYIEHDPCYNPNLTRDAENYALRIEHVRVICTRPGVPFHKFACVIDEATAYQGRSVKLRGWATTTAGEQVERLLIAIEGQPAGEAVLGYSRPDVRQAHPGSLTEHPGYHFFAKSSEPWPNNVRIAMTLIDVRGVCETCTFVLPTKLGTKSSLKSKLVNSLKNRTRPLVQQAVEGFYRRFPSYPDFRPLGTPRAAAEIVKHVSLRHGLYGTLRQTVRTAAPRFAKRLAVDVPLANNARYYLWLWQHYPREHQLQEMRQAVAGLHYQPTISIIMPVYDMEKRYLKEAIESVRRQTYPHWELCIADDCSPSPHVWPLLERYARRDSRIKFVIREKNGNISAASNSALALATGEYVGQLDHDDRLAPHALQEVVKLLNDHPEADFIYSDEDKIDLNNVHSDPFFKPDWSPDTFLTKMYTCHFAVYRRKLMEEVSGFRSQCDGAEDYDLTLRVVEKTKHVFHLPQILYHWRTHPKSTATGSRDVKTWAYKAAVRALQEALDRRGEPGTVSSIPGTPGFYHVRYQLKSSDRVSIILPARDLARCLDRCLLSVFERSSYPHYEVILVDNGSKEPETKALLAKWSRREPERFLIVDHPGSFNYSRLINAGAARSRGKYLLFLNSDTEVITPDWIEAMLEQAQRPSIGAVGAQLLYRDNTIQHAGIVVGVRGTAGHSHRHSPTHAIGYFGRVKTISNVAAVTGACLACRRAAFEELGGLDESFDSAYNDVDFCLRLIERGLYNVYLPHVKLHHHESQTWNKHYDEEKRRSYERAVVHFRSKWRHYVAHDPYYSPHLSRACESYQIG